MLLIPPSSLFGCQATEATSGMPALMNGSASRRLCSWVTSETQPALRCVRRVERPVARALVVVVVDVAGGVVDLRIGEGRIHPRGLGGRGRVLGAPEPNDHRRRGRAAPRFAAVVELGVLAVVRLLRERRHVEVDRLPVHRRRAWERALLVRQVRRDRAVAADRHRRLRVGQVRSPEDRQPELVRHRRMVLREEGVDGDEAVGISLPADRSAVEAGIVVRPAAEDVPLGPMPVVQPGLDLGLDPGARVGLRVPGRDHLVEREVHRVHGRRPCAERVAPGAVDVLTEHGHGRERIGVVVDPGPVAGELQLAVLVRETVQRPGREVDGLEVDGIRLHCGSGGRGREQEACCEPEEHYDAPKHRAILTHAFENA